MKWTILFILGFFFQGMAHGYGQGVISLSAQNLPLEKALLQIGQQSGQTIWFEDALLAKEPPLNIRLEKVSLEQALNACLNNRPLRWKLVNKVIVISRLVNEIPEPPVEGTVLNEKAEPLTGATVRVKSSGRTVVTDAFGKFEIYGVKKNDGLLISYTGYNSVEVAVTVQPLIIRLSISVSKLDEVQVMGYTSSSRRLSTGSASTVSGETIQKQPVTNVLQALSGRVAGLQVIQSGGLPGSPVTVQIRGQNSIAASNNPLYIVDGVPFTSTAVERLGGLNSSPTAKGNPLNTLNPSDIASVVVLKDADATAIYGSRGANGVILINTIKGRSGKLLFDVNLRTGRGAIARLAPVLNNNAYRQTRRTALQNSGRIPDASNAPDLVSWDSAYTTTWQDDLVGGISELTDVNAGISGGSLQTKFRINGSYHRETSVQPTADAYRRAGAHMSLDHSSLDQRFNLSTQVFYTDDANRIYGANSGMLLDYARTVPNYPTYTTQGTLNWVANKSNYLALLNAYNKSNTRNLNANLTVRYSPFKNFFLKSSLGYNLIDNEQVNPTPISAQNPAFSPTGRTNFGQQSLATFVWEPQLSYTARIWQGKLDLLAGSTVQRNESHGTNLLATGYTNDAYLENISYGTIGSTSSSSSLYKYFSMFGNLRYNLKETYQLNINFRRDGSSRFGSDHPFGNFWSLGAAWIFSKEKWFSNTLPWLSYGKLRGSYGTTGNDGIGDYGYLSTYQAGSRYGTSVAIIPNRIANEGFRWEINRKFEIALEMGAWNDRLLLNAVYYQNRSDNQLVGYALPSTTGFSSYQANLPALVENRGWEFEASGLLVKSGAFSWNTSLNISLPKNTLRSFPGLANSAYANTYVTGQPLGIVQGYRFLGVNPDNGIPLLEDLNKDGQFTPLSSYNNQGGDFMIAGKLNPDWMGGWNNTFQYKTLSLDIFFQYVQQEGYNLFSYYGNFGRLFNGWELYQDYWKQPGDLVVVPKPFAEFNSQIGNYTTSNAVVSDASFLRLKNVQLSWELPESWKTKLKISGFRLYAQGQNLWTWTKYQGYDPESLTAGNAGILLPPLKMITVGIQCSL